MTAEERFNRIENALDRTTNTLSHVVDTQLLIDATMATLAESTIKTQEELRSLAAEVRKDPGRHRFTRTPPAGLLNIREQ
jgi:hypothetical protein